MLSWASDPSPGNPGYGSYNYTNGVLTTAFIHTETMGGFVSDKSFDYYYAELFGDTISCAGTPNILSVDSCPGSTYLWNTGDTTKNIEGLKAGSYGLTITDDGIDTFYNNVTVNQPFPVFGTIIKTDIPCNSTVSAEAIVVPSSE